MYKFDQRGTDIDNGGAIAEQQPLSTRADAKRLGTKHYYTGQWCKNGHIEQRLASTGQCLGCCRMYRTQCRMDDREGYNAQARNQRVKNPMRARQLTINWINCNRDQMNETARNYVAEKYSNDPEFKLKLLLRSRINQALKNKNNHIKIGSMVRDLGCSINELRSYIAAKFQGAMSWNNWGSVWELDHEKPLFSFDLTDRAQFLIAAHYTNLQPLLIDDHRRKSAQERFRQPKHKD